MTGNGVLGRIHLRVTMADGSTLDAHPLNVDLLRWDTTASKHGWPDFQTVGIWHSTFICWAALRRTGAIPDGMTWEDFSQHQCMALTPIDAEGNEVAGDEEAPGDAVDPFRPVAVRG